MSFEAPYRAEYKGRLISAIRSEDGRWIATHVSISTKPSVAGATQTHCFLARALAVASAEMEIDELETVSQQNERHPA